MALAVCPFNTGSGSNPYVKSMDFAKLSGIHHIKIKKNKMEGI